MMRYSKAEVYLSGVRKGLYEDFLESLYQISPSPSCSLTASQNRLPRHNEYIKYTIAMPVFSDTPRLLISPRI